MQTIIVHDSRLDGETPSGPQITPIRVGGRTSIDDMIRQVRAAAIRYGTDVKLNILCHGLEQNHELGYGLLLCAEGLNLRTVDRLRPLNGQISYGIDIYACGAANTASWTVGRHGDGWLLCSRVASTTQSVVRAAQLAQWYNYFNGIGGMLRMPIDFGRWEGNVLTFDARGSEVARETSPSR